MESECTRSDCSYLPCCDGMKCHHVQFVFLCVDEATGKLHYIKLITKLIIFTYKIDVTQKIDVENQCQSLGQVCSMIPNDCCNGLRCTRMGFALTCQKID